MAGLPVAWNAIHRWWTWVFNTRRPLPWLIYDTSGAPSAVFCVVHPDTRERLSKLSTARYDKAFLDATERHRTKIQREVAHARKQHWRIPKQLTAEETRNAILQYDVVKQAEKGLGSLDKLTMSRVALQKHGYHHQLFSAETVESHLSRDTLPFRTTFSAMQKVLIIDLFLSTSLTAVLVSMNPQRSPK